MTTKKTKIHKLCTTQLFYKKYSKLLSITSKLVSSHRSSRYDCSFTHSLISPSSSKYATTIASGGIFLIRNKDLSYRHSPWRELNVKPFPSHQSNPSTTLNSNRATVATWIDWVGENPRRNENIALEPRSFVFFCCCRLFGSLLFREGKVTCVPVVLETERCSVTDTNTQQAITSISMTSHWPTPLRFM